MKATHTTQGRGEVITLATALVHGQAVAIKGTAQAAVQVGRFAQKSALSFVLRYDSEQDKLPSSESQREEVEAIYHYHAATAFAACGIVPASRAVLFGYGAPRRRMGADGLSFPSSLDASRIGARGLLPFRALLPWRRAMRRAANEARSLLNGRGRVLVGGDDGAELLAKLPARGMGDGGRAFSRSYLGAGDGDDQTSGFLWARGAADSAADSWARQVAHAGQCLRAHWKYASGPGGRGESRKAAAGLAADLALLSAFAISARDGGFNHWAAEYVGNGRAAARPVVERARVLKRRIDSGDRVLTDSPSAAGAASSLGLGASRGACGCFVCCRAAWIASGGDGARLREVAIMRGGCDGKSLASDTWRIAPVRTWEDASQAARWEQSATRAQRLNVARILGGCIVPAVAPRDALPLPAVAGWRAWWRTPAASVLRASDTRRMIHAAGRGVAKAARKLAIARETLHRLYGVASLDPRVVKAGAALAKVTSLANVASPSKRGAARKVAKVRAEYLRKRQAALLRIGAEYDGKGRVVTSAGLRAVAAKAAAADALLACQRRAEDAARTHGKAARRREDARAASAAAHAASVAASVARAAHVESVERAHASSVARAAHGATVAHGADVASVPALDDARTVAHAMTMEHRARFVAFVPAAPML